MYSTGVPGAGGLHHLAAAAAGLPAAQHTQVGVMTTWQPYLCVLLRLALTVCI